MAGIIENDIEELCIERLRQCGYRHLSAEEWDAERGDRARVVLRGRLRAAIDRLNPHVPSDTRDYAVREVMSLPAHDVIAANEAFHRFFTDGVGVEYQQRGETVGDTVWLVDVAAPAENDFVVCGQFTVRGESRTRRPDLVLFVNGLPVVVIELKAPTDERATLGAAYNQLQTYKDDIPALFQYNGLLVVSDGIDSKIGSLTGEYDRFTAWKAGAGRRAGAGARLIPVARPESVEGELVAADAAGGVTAGALAAGYALDATTTGGTERARIETLIGDLFNPSDLLDYLRHFVVFERHGAGGMGGISKKIAACHQYRAVNRAVERTSVASQASGDGKIGIVWHAQGSGKSLSMVFYAGKIVLGLGNPTIVVVTDRNDLDDQLFDTFAANRQLLRAAPQQAKSRAELQGLLKTAGGGVVFTTLQKFMPESVGGRFPLLSARRNIVVIADEAHRSHYGFAARTAVANGEVSIRYGLAKHLRDALPNASFIGFTATPVEKEDASTRAVFGNEIDIYDMQQSVEDGATVPIYYESRLAQMHWDDDAPEDMDDEVEALIAPGDEEVVEQAKRKWTALEAIVGNRRRLKIIAADIAEHFEGRQQGGDGKAMIVTMSRRIAVELYEQLAAIRPSWHSADQEQGALKVVMTAAASDPSNWQPHHTTKEERRRLGNRLKDPEDSLRLVIVCDMWLTGFDAPCLHTMYIDKPMRGHNLMQAIARVNRVYRGKDGGLIVDYIGFALDLQKAVGVYSAGGGTGMPVLDQQEAIDRMHEQYEIVSGLFAGFDYQRYFTADTSEKMTVILDAEEYILREDDVKARLYKRVGLLSRAFALALPSEAALRIRDEVSFFQAVKSRLAKLEPSDGTKSDAEMDAAIRHIVDRAVSAGKVIDIFDAAGLQKPNVAILSDQFLGQVRGMKRKNLAIELLRNILHGECRAREKKNAIQARKLSELLREVLNKYQNNLLSATQIIEELIEAAKRIREADKRGERLGLSDDEIAFYDALADNESALKVMGDENLRGLAQVLVEQVKRNTTIDWTIRESVRASLRVMVKRMLKKYGYPPDKQELATAGIIEQAELFAGEWGR